MNAASAPVQQISTAELHFDFQNPRLAEFGLTAKASEPEILRILWENMTVSELAYSIAAAGFFPHEPLIVTEEGGRYVVIEGNRRLAAVKTLIDPTVAAKFSTGGLPQVSPAIRATLHALPCLVTTRREAWQFLGFKHVNGPAKWDSYAKAKYIAKVRNEFGIQLADIASQIGDQHRTVQRLYRALMVIEQAEAMKAFDRNDRYNRRLSFSHLYTGLQYEGIKSFLKLKEETEEDKSPVPAEQAKELGELLLWLYGSAKGSTEPVVKSQNPDLRQLAAVLAHHEATAALRASVPLVQAYEISRPEKDVFEETLLEAKRTLQKARSYVTGGYDGEEELLRTAGTVAQLADDLYREMERKKSETTGAKRWITEEG